MGGSQSTTSSNKKKNHHSTTISNVDRAILDLKNARDRLSKYQRTLEVEETKLVTKARQAKQEGKMKMALQLLKVKKMKRNELDACSNQLLNVLQMVQTIDSKQNETQVLQAMKTGKDALQKMQQETTVEDVLDLMDSIQEQHQVEQEISDILQRVPDQLSMEDEAAVEAELEALMMMDVEENNKDVTTLPDVPTTQPLPIAPTGNLSPPTATNANNNTIKEERTALPS